ncbi:MAG: alpha-E domain-containing protein [Eubacteriales bacterium]|nr:alpha-E domain-containing protein [Eubacteriales bacterium]
MGTISLEKRDSLYWLGRYTERVYTTLKAFYDYYDQMIDRQADAYKSLCERLDIPNIYKSEADFIHRFLFDSNDPNSIFTSLNRSYDNGILLRDEITSDSLAYIQMSLDIYAASSHSDVPTMALLPVQDYLLAFWASIDDNIWDQRARNIIKCGRYVERLDLYFRLSFPTAAIERTLCKMTPRLKQCGIAYDQEVLDILYARVREKLLHTPGWRHECARLLMTLITE